MADNASSSSRRRATANDDGGASSSSSSSSSTTIDALVALGLFLFTLGFVFFRGMEIAKCVHAYGNRLASALLGTVALASSLGSRRSRCLLHVASLVVVAHLLDRRIPKPLPAPGGGAGHYHSGKTVVVTGANSGIGYETSRRLAADYGMRVIMGCRSMAKCNDAAAAINAELMTSSSSSSKGSGGGGSVTPMEIDLSSFESVESFASALIKSGTIVDTLFNNAGYAPTAGVPVNGHGLESSFASMHLAHFQLAELLLKENPRMRVVNTSSGTSHICAIASSLRGGGNCIDEEFLRVGIRSPTDHLAYIRAKLANVMHAVEIPRRHPMATAVAIDLGWVGTSIQPWMKGVLLTPSSLGMMRTARIGVLPVLLAILSSDEELSDDLRAGRKLNDAGIMMNVFGRPEEAFSMPWWRDGVNANLSRDSMLWMGERLWDESVKILQLHGH